MKCKFCENDLEKSKLLCNKCSNQSDNDIIESNQLTEEDLLKLYARKDSVKIFYQKWSWPAFLFGPLYFWYRKMISAGFFSYKLLYSNQLDIYYIKYYTFYNFRINF